MSNYNTKDYGKVKIIMGSETVKSINDTTNRESRNEDQFKKKKES